MSTIKVHLFALVVSLALWGSGCASPPTQTSAFEPTSTTSQVSNDVLISFIRDASDGMDEKSACLAAHDIYRFVLYGDGHLITFDGVQYLETKISQAEIGELLSEIEATGFSSLSGNGDQYTQNSPPPSFIDPWGGSITVNDKTITVTPGQSDYLVEPVIQTLNIIENYKPENLKPYAPESATLWVYRDEDIVLGIANPTPEPPVLKWTVEQIDLNKLLIDLATSKPQVVAGDSLSFLIGQLEHVPVVRRVEQNGQLYLIVLCPNFP